MQQASSHSITFLRVILLENDDLLRDQILTPNLSRLGFVITALGHPDQPIAMVAAQPPDIVVVDVGLPGRDGFDVTRELRSQHADIGVVMLTGRDSNVDRVRGLSEGADAYLAKPVDIDVLAATKTEASLLLALLETPNKLVSRDQLIALLTDNAYDFDPHRLDSIIHRLRRKVRQVLGELLLLNAVHGGGYVLVQS